MFGIFDIYLLEALINGILLGGVLALLALGLNLIFGVIDVVWIAYADIVMCGMYMLYWLYVGLGGLLFRTVHLFFLQGVQTGLVWITKIITDPFHDVYLY